MVEIVLKDVGGVIRDTLDANYGDIYRVTGCCVSQKDTKDAVTSSWNTAPERYKGAIA